MIGAEYLAGFFDGEGHISVCGKRRGVNFCLTNCNLEVLLEIQKSFGGRIDVRHPTKPQHAIGYRLIWASNKAKPVMEAILPYLVVKKREIEFFLRTWYKLSRHGSDTERKEVVAKIRELAKERRGEYPLMVN